MLCCPEHAGYLKNRHEMRHETGRVTRYTEQNKLGRTPEEMRMQVKFRRELCRAMQMYMTYTSPMWKMREVTQRLEEKHNTTDSKKSGAHTPEKNSEEGGKSRLKSLSFPSGLFSEDMDGGSTDLCL